MSLEQRIVDNLQHAKIQIDHLIKAFSEAKTIAGMASVVNLHLNNYPGSFIRLESICLNAIHAMIEEKELK